MEKWVVTLDEKCRLNGTHVSPPSLSLFVFVSLRYDYTRWRHRGGSDWKILPSGHRKTAGVYILICCFHLSVWALKAGWGVSRTNFQLNPVSEKLCLNTQVRWRSGFASGVVWGFFYDLIWFDLFIFAVGNLEAIITDMNLSSPWDFFAWDYYFHRT